MSDLSKTVLQVKDLAKSFFFENEKNDVLKDVSLNLESGESLSIRGDSGCGKTTLLNLLSRLESGDSGEIWWGEHKMIASRRCSSKDGQRRAHFLGVVYQSYYLIPELDVLENVLIAAKLNRFCGSDAIDRARQLLSRMGVGNKEKQIPGKLSGGERQRVAIARAMINSPKLILADEPTGNLDERTAGDVMDLLLDSCDVENAALILVTHNQKFADLTGQRLFLRHGKLNEEG